MWSELLGFCSASEKGWGTCCGADVRDREVVQKAKCNVVQLRARCRPFPRFLFKLVLRLKMNLLPWQFFVPLRSATRSVLCSPSTKQEDLTLPQITCSKSCLQDQSLKEQRMFFFKLFQSKYWRNIPLTCSEVVILTWWGWGGSHHLLVLSGWSSSFCCSMLCCKSVSNFPVTLSFAQLPYL